MKKRVSKKRKEYIIVNDAFIFTIIQFIEVDYVKRLLDDAVAHILLVKAYYTQFRTFTYVRVASTTINPKKLLRYPSDRLVLLEIS